jgi:hypothetical protein
MNKNTIAIIGIILFLIIAILIGQNIITKSWLVMAIAILVAVAYIYTKKTGSGNIALPEIFSETKKNNYTIDQQYNIDKAKKQKEIDAILDKINKNGLGSLSTREKMVLEEFGKK